MEDEMGTWNLRYCLGTRFRVLGRSCPLIKYYLAGILPLITGIRISGLEYMIGLLNILGGLRFLTLVQWNIGTKFQMVWGLVCLSTSRFRRP